MISNKLVIPFKNFELKKNILSKIENIEDRSSLNDYYPEYDINRVLITFKNGYCLSIIRGTMTYGGDKGLFEIAPFNKENEMDGSIIGVFDDDVLGYLSVEEVNKYIEEIANKK